MRERIDQLQTKYLRTRFASRSLQAYWSGGYLDSFMSFVVFRYKASNFQKSSSIICSSRSSTPADFCWRTSYVWYVLPYYFWLSHLADATTHLIDAALGATI